MQPETAIGWAPFGGFLVSGAPNRRMLNVPDFNPGE